MDNHIVQAELLGNADGREDIVGPVGMKVSLYLTAQHRQKRLTLHVKLRRIHIGVYRSPVLLFKILPRLEQRLADNGRRGHAGDGRLIAVVIAALGILAQCKFHGSRCLNDHIVNPAAPGPDGQPPDRPPGWQSPAK